MVLSSPSFLAAATSWSIPPRSAADLAVAASPAAEAPPAEAARARSAAVGSGQTILFIDYLPLLCAGAQSTPFVTMSLPLSGPTRLVDGPVQPALVDLHPPARP